MMLKVNAITFFFRRQEPSSHRVDLVEVKTVARIKYVRYRYVVSGMKIFERYVTLLVLSY